jgi:hypothetical protein
MNSRFFFRLSQSGDSIAQESPQKMAEVVHELEFAVYLVGSFFLSSGFFFCTCQSPVEVIY